jgi:chromosome segregation ATPase
MKDSETNSQLKESNMELENECNQLHEEKLGLEADL